MSHRCSADVPAASFSLLKEGIDGKNPCEINHRDMIRSHPMAKRDCLIRSIPADNITGGPTIASTGISRYEAPRTTECSDTRRLWGSGETSPIGGSLVEGFGLVFPVSLVFSLANAAGLFP